MIRLDDFLRLQRLADNPDSEKHVACIFTTKQLSQSFFTYKAKILYYQWNYLLKLEERSCTLKFIIANSRSIRKLSWVIWGIIPGNFNCKNSNWFLQVLQLGEEPVSNCYPSHTFSIFLLVTTTNLEFLFKIWEHLFTWCLLTKLIL